MHLPLSPILGFILGAITIYLARRLAYPLFRSHYLWTPLVGALVASLCDAFTASPDPSCLINWPMLILVTTTVLSTLLTTWLIRHYHTTSHN